MQLGILYLGTADDAGDGDPLRRAGEKMNTGGRVLSRTTDIPGAPSHGDLYIIPAGATGAWAGLDDQVAWYDGVTAMDWEYYVPTEGWAAWVIDTQEMVVYKSSVWDNTAIGAGGGGGGTTTINFTGTGRTYGGKSTVATDITDFTVDTVVDLSDCDEVEIYLFNFSPSVSGAPSVVLSDNGGSTYDSSYTEDQTVLTSGGGASGTMNNVVTEMSLTFAGTGPTTASLSRIVDFREGNAPTRMDTEIIGSGNSMLKRSRTPTAKVYDTLKVAAITAPTSGTMRVVKISYAQPATVQFKSASASFSLDDTDLVGQVYYDIDTSGGDVTITIPDTLTGTEPVAFENTGTNSVIFAAGGTTTLNSVGSAVTIYNQIGIATLLPKGSNVYTLMGDIS